MNKKTRLVSAVVATTALSLLAPAVAGAQGYGPPPPPPSRGYHSGGGAPGSWGFVQRRGLTLGVGGAVGVMSSASDNLTECFNCDYQPLAGMFDFHIGTMINPRTALLFEFLLPAQLIDDQFADFLVQPTFLGAVQFWVAPQIWIKGGLGFASLQVSYSDGGPNDELDTGGAGMIAAGFEILQAPNFTIDLHARGTTTTYHGLDDKVGTFTVGAGANWF